MAADHCLGGQEVVWVHDALEQDEATLVLAAQAGDEDAFAQLFRRHHAAVRRVCTRRLGNDSDADEVAQAAFVRAYERIDQCRGDRRFGAWVQVIALRLCGDEWRTRTRTTPVAEPRPPGGEQDPCMDAVLRKERAADVGCALATLPPRERAVIVARYVDGHRPRDLAAALAVSVGAIDSLLLRARRRMVAAYQATGVEHGAASPSVVTGSLAAGSAAAELRPLLRPLIRLTRSQAGVVDAIGTGMAGALGLGHAGPATAQRAAGLVGAGALLLAPMASTNDGPPPEALDRRSDVRALSVDAGDLAGDLELPGGLAATLPPLALPSLALPAVALPALSAPALPARPVPALSAPPTASLPGVTAATGASAPAPPGLEAAASDALGQVAETVTAAVGDASVVVTSTVEARVGVVAGILGPPPAPPALL